MQASVPPRFVTFEGLDGCGKSTQLALASAHLESVGRRHLVTHEPGGTPLGERLRAAFLDPGEGSLDGTVEALVVFASRRQHLLEVIEPALEDGLDVLCDRFTDSTIAYQGGGRGVPEATLRTLDQLATGARRPDLTLLFELPAEMARQRGAGARRAEVEALDRLDREAIEFYRRVAEGYREIARGEPDRVRVIDASGEVEATFAQVKKVLDQVLGATP